MRMASDEGLINGGLPVAVPLNVSAPRPWERGMVGLAMIGHQNLPPGHRHPLDEQAA
jgi:hypothetical protein